MITKPTVFILGAGASAPYGLPLGAELISTIARRDYPADLLDLLRHHIRSDVDKKLQELSDAVQRAALPSIDDFFAKRKLFAQIGRLIVAHKIASREHDDRLFNAKNDVDWYAYLWRHMLEGCDTASDFARNSVSFITFNYDRSLERCLSVRLSEAFREVSSAPEIRQATLALPIVHVHGSIGALPELCEPGQQTGSLAYGSPPPSVEDIATRIKFIGEHDGQSADFARACELLRSANLIVFLGFGFHEHNVRNLRPETWFDDLSKRLFASAMELSPSEQAKCRKRFPYRGSNDMRMQVADAFALLRNNIAELE